MRMAPKSQEQGATRNWSCRCMLDLHAMQVEAYASEAYADPTTTRRSETRACQEFLTPPGAPKKARVAANIGMQARKESMQARRTFAGDDVLATVE